MPAIKLRGFDGFFPRRGDYLLEDNQAQIAENVKLYSGEIRGWRAPVPLDPPQPIVLDPLAIFRIERPTDRAEAWLSWQTDVDVALSPIADTADGRFYYTGDGPPKKSFFNLAVTGPGPYPAGFLPMGVVAPMTPPILTNTVSGSGTLQTRVYVYTFVSTFGSIKEESAPSPPATIISHPIGSTVTVSGLGNASPMGYNITHKRIYRTIGGNTGIDYRLVAEIPVTQASFDDNLNDADVPGDPIISIDFTEPPEDLKGVQVVTGSFLVGFTKNEVWFSEPLFPHAWPAKYVMTTEFPIVGLGVVGGLIVVLTDRFPEIIYGNDPGSLGQEKIPLNEPCASKRSIATDGSAVIYASPNGLVAIGPGTRQRFTDRLFRREEFQEYNPASMYGRVYDGTYFGYFDSLIQGRGALLVNSIDTPTLSRINLHTTAAFINTRTASLFYVDEDRIVEFDADPTEFVEYRWRSKKFDLPFPTSMGIIKVYADYEFLNQPVADPAPTILFNEALIATDDVVGMLNTVTLGEILIDPAANYTLNGTNIRRAPQAGDTRFIDVDVIGDGEVIARTTFKNERLIKLPAGKRYRTLELEIRGNVPVYSVGIANAAADLKDV